MPRVKGFLTNELPFNELWPLNHPEIAHNQAPYINRQEEKEFVVTIMNGLRMDELSAEVEVLESSVTPLKRIRTRGNHANMLKKQNTQEAIQDSRPHHQDRPELEKIVSECTECRTGS